MGMDPEERELQVELASLTTFSNLGLAITAIGGVLVSVSASLALIPGASTGIITIIGQSIVFFALGLGLFIHTLIQINKLKYREVPKGSK